GERDAHLRPLGAGAPAAASSASTRRLRLAISKAWLSCARLNIVASSSGRGSTTSAAVSTASAALAGAFLAVFVALAALRAREAVAVLVAIIDPRDLQVIYTADVVSRAI